MTVELQTVVQPVQPLSRWLLLCVILAPFVGMWIGYLDGRCGSGGWE